MNSSHKVNPEAFYTMLEYAQQPLHDGCNIIELETSMRVLRIKSVHNMAQHCFNEVVGLMKDTCPPESRIPKNFHKLLRKARGLGMDVQEIDCCPNGACFIVNMMKICLHANFVDKQDEHHRTPVKGDIRGFHMRKCSAFL